MAIQYILGRRKNEIRLNLYLAVGHFWLAGSVGPVLARFGRPETNSAIAAHNKPLQTINFIIRGE